MGIQGLATELKQSGRLVNVSQFSGSTFAVDISIWLHPGLRRCATTIANGGDCNVYVNYCMQLVNMLLAKNIKPILVFDGQDLPLKAEKKLERQKFRKQCRKKASELMLLGKKKEALSQLKNSISITYHMVLKLIKRCRKIGVDCIVAPYEADAQLAYLNLNGIADIVLSNDSDMMAFGCRKVIYDLDNYGNGILVEQEKLYLLMNIRPEQFNLDKFCCMCILSGCDYLPSTPGFGLKKAKRFITNISEFNIHKFLSELESFINIKMSSEYKNKFMDAFYMYKYQLIYDPICRDVKPLNKICGQLDVISLLKNLTNGQFLQLALGNINPVSLKVMDDWDPDWKNIIPKKISKYKIIKGHRASIWSKDYLTSMCHKNVPIPNIVKSITNRPLQLMSKKFPSVTNIITTLKEMDINKKESKKNETYSIERCPVTKVSKPLIQKKIRWTTKNGLKIIINRGEPKTNLEHETKTSRRQKQIAFGKTTIGYYKYREQVPIHERKKEHPKTPEMDMKYTRREWDGLVKNWKLRLHCWDPVNINDNNAPTVNYSSNMYSNLEENKLHCLADEKSNTQHKITTNKTQTAYYDMKKKNTINTSITNKIKEDDKNRKYCSQNVKQINVSNIKPKQQKHSFPQNSRTNESNKSGPQIPRTLDSIPWYKYP